MVNPNINSFGQTPVQGEMDLSTQGTVITARVSPNQATALIAGQAVQIDTAVSSTGVLPVKALASNADTAFGFVARNIKDINRPTNSNLELAMQGSVMYMTAGAAITIGSKIEVVQATNKVITNAGTNPVVGWALDTALADGDLIRVYITTQSYATAQNISGVAGLQEALNNAGGAEARVITALTTAGAGTITAAGIFGGVTARSGPTAAFADTTDTAAALAALFTGLTIGDSIEYTYQNNTAFQATLSGGSGITVSVQTVVQGNSWVRYLLTYTGTNTFTMVAMEAGMMNNTLTNAINSGSKVCTAQVDRATSTVLTNVTGCAVALLAAGKYIFEAHITGVATANGGMKAAIAGDGTLSATSFSCTGTNFNTTTTNAQSTTTTLGTAVGAATAATTDMYLEGAIVVNAAGVLNLQIAQNASHSDTTSAYVNSFLKVTRVA